MNLQLPELMIDGQRVDGRTGIARRYRDQLQALNDQHGGNPSIADEMLLRRAATLSVLCEQAEQKLLSGEEINENNFRHNTAALRTLLQSLMLVKQTRAILKGDYKTYDAHTAAVLEM